MSGKRAAWRFYAAGSEGQHFADFCREYLTYERIELRLAL